VVQGIQGHIRRLPSPAETDRAEEVKALLAYVDEVQEKATLDWVLAVFGQYTRQYTITPGPEADTP
jgi:hypothetical protein